MGGPPSNPKSVSYTHLKLPELSKDAQHSLTVLKKAKEYLEAKPEIAEELSAAERRKMCIRDRPGHPQSFLQWSEKWR